MNTTEKAARAWLSKTTGYTEDQIIFYPSDTPDFILPDGSMYEVKFLYKDKIILYPTQLEALKKQPEAKILVFSKHGEEPTTVIPAKELVDSVSSGKLAWHNIKIVPYMDGLTKLQIFLTPELKEALDRYMEANNTEENQTASDVIVKALDDFLDLKGFPSIQGGGYEDLS